MCMHKVSVVSHTRCISSTFSYSCFLACRCGFVIVSSVSRSSSALSIPTLSAAAKVLSHILREQRVHKMPVWRKSLPKNVQESFHVQISALCARLPKARLQCPCQFLPVFTRSRLRQPHHESYSRELGDPQSILRALGEFHLTAHGQVSSCTGDEMTLVCSPTPLHLYPGHPHLVQF